MIQWRLYQIILHTVKSNSKDSKEWMCWWGIVFQRGGVGMFRSSLLRSEKFGENQRQEDFSSDCEVWFFSFHYLLASLTLHTQIHTAISLALDNFFSFLVYCLNLSFWKRRESQMVVSSDITISKAMASRVRFRRRSLRICWSCFRNSLFISQCKNSN